MPKKKSQKRKKYSGTEIESGYAKATEDNLFLKDMTPKTGHLGSLSTNKKGKEIAVGKQISSYLKSMQLLEKSLSDLEKSLECSDSALKETDNLLETSIVKKRYNGKMYSTTSKMIEAVNLFEKGKIDKDLLNLAASWAENPSAAIEVARMIAGIR